MGKVWVLDTSTKGTGATMVPLESTLAKPEAPPARPYRPPKRAPREPRPPEPKQPPQFRVVDAMSGELLAEDVGARETVDILGELLSVVDARVYVRRPPAISWRLLTLGEQKALRERRRATLSGR